jgi:hypothetical protein
MVWEEEEKGAVEEEQEEKEIREKHLCLIQPLKHQIRIFFHFLLFFI